MGKIFYAVLCVVALSLIGFFDLQGSLSYLKAKLFDEASLSSLRTVKNSTEKLDREVADAFEAMTEKARMQGVVLIPRSGFRSISYQKELWDRMRRKVGSMKTQTILKPPGESEHQTGFAVDIATTANSRCSLKQCFASTKAYQWLQLYAADFGFELSYPEGNDEGIIFEPWHWRYIR